MQRTSGLGAMALAIGFSLFTTTDAAADAADCRRAVNKNTAKLYATVAKGAVKCMKTAVKDDTSSAVCTTPAGYDPNGKVVTDKLLEALQDDANGGKCGTGLGLLYSDVCDNEPAACNSACVGTCVSREVIADCILCRVTEDALAQTEALYGTPPAGLKVNFPDGAKCQDTIGKSGVKYGRARMKDQHLCTALIDSGGVGASTDCATADVLGRISSANAKNSTKVLDTCKTKPGSDQVNGILDNTALCLPDADTASTCAVDITGESIDSIFDAVSAPASVEGVVTALIGMDLVPIENVRVEFPDAGVGVFTDSAGEFVIGGLPNGMQDYTVDGTTAGCFSQIETSTTTGLVGTIDVGNHTLTVIEGGGGGSPPSARRARDTDTTAPFTLTNPNVPGVEVSIASGTNLDFTPDNTHPFLTITAVPVTPAPYPASVSPTAVYTFQPANLALTPAAALTLPNTTGGPAGGSVNIYRLNPSSGAYEVVGTGTIDGTGTVINSDGGVVAEFGFYFAAIPAPCTTTIVGRVVEGGGVGTPVAGVNLCTNGLCATPTGNAFVTDDLGAFSISVPNCPPTTVLASQRLGSGQIRTGVGSAVTVPSGLTDVGDINLDFPECGNGALDGVEECDDGNRLATDGCSPTCTIEDCGNGIEEGIEQCDLGAANGQAGSGCTAFCTVCGDGVIRAPGEQCDLGAANGQPGSGCSSICTTSVCGNGIREAGEACDNGDANGGKFSLCETDCTVAPVEANRFDLVRGFAECTSPNDNTDPGTPACSPPVAASNFNFGPNGGGSAFIGMTKNGQDAIVAASLSGIAQSDGLTPVASADGWRVRTTLRVTLLGSSFFGDLTLGDLTLTGALTLESSGSLRGATTLAPVTGDLSSFRDRIVQVVSMEVVDPAGSVFAVPGFYFSAGDAPGFDAPANSPSSLFGLVESYQACDAPTTQFGGHPACDPPVRSSVHSLSSAAKTLARYKSASSDASIDAKVSGIRDADGNTPTDPSGFGASFVLRTTIVDPGSAGGEVTVIDFPVQFPASGKKGSLTVNSSLQEAWLALFGPGSTLQATEAALVPTGSGGPTAAMPPIITDGSGNAFLGPGVRTAR